MSPRISPQFLAQPFIRDLQRGFLADGLCHQRLPEVPTMREVRHQLNQLQTLAVEAHGVCSKRIAFGAIHVGQCMRLCFPESNYKM